MTQTELDFSAPQGYATPRAEPTKPTPGTQCYRLLEHLKYWPINPLQSWRQCGIYRLSARVFDLRELGYDIKSTTITVQNSFGEKCRVAEYSLEV